MMDWTCSSYCVLRGGKTRDFILYSGTQRMTKSTSVGMAHQNSMIIFSNGGSTILSRVISVYLIDTMIYYWMAYHVSTHGGTTKLTNVEHILWLSNLNLISNLVCLPVV